ncbi:acyl-CoA thioesterase [Shewanella sp. GXUN23E]|uniref:acyl-CoA thioesterase n=1 Tax=Shewanella sp. GXUN23E TaxID=3422498 RepID=UPI003D7D502C
MTAFTLELTPRFNETDALGHINNTVIPGWFEAGRTPVFEIFNPLLDLQRWNLIVAGYNIAFKAPTYYGSVVTITTEVARIGSASFDLRQRCWQQGKMTAQAVTTMVHYNYDAECSEPIPEPIKAALAAHMVTN